MNEAFSGGDFGQGWKRAALHKPEYCKPGTPDWLCKKRKTKRGLFNRYFDANPDELKMGTVDLAGTGLLVRQLARAKQVSLAAKTAKASKAASNTVNLSQKLTKHIVDNIPIDATTARAVISRNAAMAAKGAVYRGMHVTEDYIKATYPQTLAKGPGVHVVQTTRSARPRSGTSTASWTEDFSEASLWGQGGAQGARANQTIEIIYVAKAAEKGNQGLHISKLARGMRHADEAADHAEVAMIGRVKLDKIIIINRTGLQPGQHLARFENLAPGFYPAGSREQILKLRK